MVFRATILFERRIKQGSLTLNNGDGFFIGSKDFYQSKIDQFEQSVRRNFQVGWFNVSVHDGRQLAVQIRERVSELGNPIQHIRFT